MNDSIIELKKKMKKVLDRDRYQHTLGVAYTAASLAMRYNLDIDKAFTAGLLHDCAKCIPNDEKLRLCKKFGIQLTDAEKNVPSLTHAKLGACLAEKEYGVTDPDILAAVRTHTTGAPGMSRLQEIIFMADYIEPNRNTAPNLKEVRSLCFNNPAIAIRKILSDTLQYLNKRKDSAIDPATKDTYDYYKNETEKVEWV